ncbi:sulfoxide reductase heme-binding subunit YedZ [Maribacter sedimenticola]|uniref:Sulfoxide reductase heme-binding subunit YedZ n=1 Tax=Maribacter sedimenticola TaxID=228956 RepID=A0ABY1SJ65_9FLAO|nr:ferric reductase-like transmembrane domain-containing protein [Maribacter sedimenticola]SNR58440.1 sulfoxide reductase heme-binding subunit YedZ [Maribacter sedimenticola]
MNNLKSLLTGKYMLWLLLAIPGVMMTLDYAKGQFKYEDIMHITGEFAARMLIISLIATPIRLMFPKTKVAQWLLRNRRFFGVAAFAYTLLHTIFYVLEFPISKIVNESIELSILTGWIAFFVFIPLAMTSTNAAVKRMGRNWKKLQQWVYLAAIMAFAHWALLGLQGEEGSMAGALAHFVPVMLLQLYRIYKQKFSK